MPFRPKHSLLNIDVEKMHTIDTRSVENLFGMWSVFSKSSDALEDGKRLENMSWRLWNRETFCCEPRTQARSTALSPQIKFPPRAKSSSIPELASSVDTLSSVDSEQDETLTSLPSPTNLVRPEPSRFDSLESRSRGREKHITPIDLERIVVSIKEKKVLEPLSPLPIPALSEPEKQEASTTQPATRRQSNVTEQVVEPEVTPNDAPAQDIPSPEFQMNLESSTSTMETSSSNDSHPRKSSDSSSTAMSTHNVIRGFVPGGMPSSYRSQTQLAAQPTPILKNSPRAGQLKEARKKGAMFTLGGSSDEGEGSLDSHMYKNSVSSISEQLHQPPPRKQTLFKDEVSRAVQDSPVFESDDEDEDEEVSDNAIEDDDEDSDEWEDELGEEANYSTDERDLFQRVDSRPNLTSRRSLLTSLMHEGDRAKALANIASRSVPAMHRSRTSSPNGPSGTASPRQGPSCGPNALPNVTEASRAKPIIMTTSNTHQLALSPRSTRRNMLSTELTESLRKNLLWERQHKSSQNIAALKRRHTSSDVKNLRQHPEPTPVMNANAATPAHTNEHFHNGLNQFHETGW